jgi:hypothetical protein
MELGGVARPPAQLLQQRAFPSPSRLSIADLSADYRVVTMAVPSTPRRTAGGWEIPGRREVTGVRSVAAHEFVAVRL